MSFKPPQTPEDFGGGGEHILSSFKVAKSQWKEQFLAWSQILLRSEDVDLVNIRLI